MQFPSIVDGMNNIAIITFVNKLFWKHLSHFK